MNKFCKGSQRHGFSLVEVMIAVLIIIIVALGTLSFQYHGIKHSRASEAQIAAARLGQLLIEDWKSTDGKLTYDPATLGLGFILVSPWNYVITLDNQTFYLQLAWEHVDIPNNPDPVANVELYQISVTVSWRNDFGTGPITSSDHTLTFTTFGGK
jgi:prepilin-type N-terminal cleavage/methylation domain-containing protein